MTTRPTIQPTSPVRGEEFVWMEGNPGHWPEITQQVGDVVGELPGGRFLVEYGLPSITKVPQVFTETYGAAFGAPRLCSCVIVFRNGRWRNDV